jgi:hypothetical protein
LIFKNGARKFFLSHYDIDDLFYKGWQKLEIEARYTAENIKASKKYKKRQKRTEVLIIKISNSRIDQEYLKKNTLSLDS